MYPIYTDVRHKPSFHLLSFRQVTKQNTKTLCWSGADSFVTGNLHFLTNYVFISSLVLVTCNRRSSNLIYTLKTLEIVNSLIFRYFSMCNTHIHIWLSGSNEIRNLSYISDDCLHSSSKLMKSYLITFLFAAIIIVNLFSNKRKYTIWPFSLL